MVSSISHILKFICHSSVIFSALMLLVGQQEGHLACRKTEWWGAGMLIGVQTCIQPS